MRCARPSAIAVLPTPGSPISTGLFLVRRDSTWITRRISSSRPITGSSLPSRASAVRSRPYFSSALYCCSASGESTWREPRSFLSAATSAPCEAPWSASSALAGESTSREREEQVLARDVAVAPRPSPARSAASNTSRSRAARMRGCRFVAPCTLGSSPAAASARAAQRGDVDAARGERVALDAGVQVEQRRAAGAAARAPGCRAPRRARTAPDSASRARVVNRSASMSAPPRGQSSLRQRGLRGGRGTCTSSSDIERVRRAGARRGAAPRCPRARRCALVRARSSSSSSST